MSKRKDLPAVSIPPAIAAKVAANQQNVAEQLGRVLGTPNGNRQGGANDDAELAEIFNGLKGLSGDLKNFSQERRDIQSRLEGLEGLRASVQALEQHMAMHNQGAGDGGGFPVGLLGQQAVTALQEDGQFAAAAAAAQRGMKVSQFGARENIDGNIRYSQTNDGGGSSSSEGATYPTRPNRNPAIQLGGLRPLRLLDLMPSRPVGSDAFEYIELHATGDADYQETEGAEKAEIDFDGVLKSGSIATVAGHTTASKQVLADNAGLSAAIDTMIRHKVLSKLEHQLINGVGGQGKIEGLLAHAVTLVPTIGTTPADIIGESLVRQADKGYIPRVVLLNPLDWFRIQISKTDTEGEYLFGSPTMPVPPALWNVPVVWTPSVPQGTGLTVDTSFTTVLDREQMSVMIFNSHKDYATRNLILMLGELRAGLEVLDAWAVYKFDLEASSGL